MPVTDKQKEYIESSISHIFDELPGDPNLLMGTIQAIQDAFLGELEEKNEFFDLQNCIYFPGLNLRSIADVNKNLTIGEIQEYILYYANKRLTSYAEQGDLQLDGCWDPGEILKTLSSDEEFNQPFKSFPLAIDSGDDPNVLSVPEDSIYKAKLKAFDAAGAEVIVGIYPTHNTRVQETIKTLSPLVIYNPNRQEGAQEDKEHEVKQHEDEWGEESMDGVQDYQVREVGEKEFRELIKQEAQLQVENKAFELACDYLGMSPERQSRFTQAGKQILLNAFYFSALSRREMSVKDICGISFAALPILTAPIIKYLLEIEYLTIQQAIKIQPHQLKVILHHVYAKQIKQDPSMLDIIILMTERQCAILLQPVISHLRERNKISLVDTLYLPSAAARVIEDPNYFKLAMNNSLDFNCMRNLSDKQADLLLLPEMTKWMMDSNITIQDVISLPVDVTNLLITKEMRNLLVGFQQKFVSLVGDEREEKWEEFMKCMHELICKESATQRHGLFAVSANTVSAPLENFCQKLLAPTQFDPWEEEDVSSMTLGGRV